MKKWLAGSALFFAPLIALAQTPNLQPITSFIQGVGNIIAMLVYILIALAVVVFFFGLVRFIASGGELKTEGKKIMMAGLVSLFVMVAVWGIINFAIGIFGFTNNNVQPPVVPGYNGSGGSVPAASAPANSTATYNI